jgi:hypothetical protein
MLIGGPPGQTMLEDPAGLKEIRESISKIKVRPFDCDRKVVNVIWSHYADYFANDEEGFLHPDFSVEAHRSALQSRRAINDMNTLRLKLNSLIENLHVGAGLLRRTVQVLTIKAQDAEERKKFEKSEF